MPTMIFLKNLLKCLPTTITTAPPQPLSPPLPQEDNNRRSLSSSSTSIMIKSYFNSPHDHSCSSSASTSNKTLIISPPSSSSTFYSESGSDSDSTATPPDFTTIFASQRFFFSSPGRSNSIFESPDTLPAAEELPHDQTPPPLNAGAVAVKKYSPDPYTDFKGSMQEMIEARELEKDVTSADWDYLHELLSCYLTLNPKHTHKFIISAFADIVVSLLSSSPESSAIHRKHEGLRATR